MDRKPCTCHANCAAACSCHCLTAAQSVTWLAGKALGTPELRALWNGTAREVPLARGTELALPTDSPSKALLLVKKNIFQLVAQAGLPCGSEVMLTGPFSPQAPATEGGGRRRLMQTTLTSIYTDVPQRNVKYACAGEGRGRGRLSVLVSSLGMHCQ